MSCLVVEWEAQLEENNTVRGEDFIPKDEAIPLSETREYWPARRNRAHVCFAGHKASSDPSNYNLWVDADMHVRTALDWFSAVGFSLISGWSVNVYLNK